MWLHEITINAPEGTVDTAADKPVKLIRLSDLTDCLGDVLRSVGRSPHLVTVNGLPVAAVVGVAEDADPELFSRQVGSTELNRKLSSLIKKVSEGESLIVTRYSTPLAALVPAALTAEDELDLLRHDDDLIKSLQAAQESVRYEGTYRPLQASHGETPSSVGRHWEFAPPSLEHLVEELQDVGIETDNLEDVLKQANTRQRELIDEVFDATLGLLCQSEAEPVRRRFFELAQQGKVAA